MTTIREVAAAARVSPSTVSLVLNGRGRVRPQTRERIKSVAHQLGYHPQTVGRPALKQTPAANIAVLYSPRAVNHGRLSVLTAAWLEGVRSAVVTSGNHISLLAGTDHIEKDLMFQQIIKAGEVNAVLLIALGPDDGYLDWVLQQDLPVVAMNRKPQHEEFSYVAMDNYGAGFLVL